MLISAVQQSRSVLYIFICRCIDIPGGTSGKNPTANAGDIRDVGLIPGLGRYSGGGHGNPL